MDRNPDPDLNPNSTSDSRRYHAEPAADPAADAAIGTGGEDRARDRRADAGDAGDAVATTDRGGGPAMTIGEMEAVGDTDTAGEPG